jgi:hypothetical protein
MTFRGHVKNRQIVLDEPVQLPDGTTVSVEVTSQNGRITRAKLRPQKIEPIRLPGPSWADELVRERR